MQLFDGLRNLVSGLGTSRDKAAGIEFASVVELSDVQLTAAYRDSALAQKIVDIPALDCVREWREWQAEKDQISKIEAEEKRLNLQATVARAMKLSRLRGGSAIYIGTGEQDASKPLNPDRIAQGGVKYLAVLSKRDLGEGELQLDPRQPGFQEPQDFQLVSGAGGHVTIHPSRLVIFNGNRLPDDHATVGARWWGDSILQAVLKEVAASDAVFANISSLIYEAKVDVVKIPGFTDKLRNGGSIYEQSMLNRWQLAMTGKGINGALMIDKEEEYEQKSASFSTLDSIIDRFMTKVAAAADIPATRLWGMSPAGMNATGESDTRNYYDRIKTHQTLEVGPAMHMLDEALIRSALGSRPEEVFFNWKPLWQPTEKERAEVADKITTSFERITRMEILPTEAVANAVVNALTETGVAPGLEADVKGFYEGEDDDGPDIDPDTGEPIADAAPRTLYVHRKVENAKDIIAWAKEQGFETTLESDDLHVTIAFSREPVDWMKMGQAWEERVEVGEGGARLMERFGDARVLLFASSELSWRHENMKRAGAKWDHPEYQPHITISYAPGSPDLSNVKPYQGKIILGPEIFQEVNEDWLEGVKEA